MGGGVLVVLLGAHSRPETRRHLWQLPEVVSWTGQDGHDMMIAPCMSFMLPKLHSVYMTPGWLLRMAEPLLLQLLCRCGFEPDASLTTLSMLTSIEVRLEECLTAVDALPAAQVGWQRKHSDFDLAAGCLTLEKTSNPT